MFNESLAWASARSNCLTMQADLTSISSVDENQFLSNVTGQHVWIGLKGIVPMKDN